MNWAIKSQIKENTIAVPAQTNNNDHVFCKSARIMKLYFEPEVIIVSKLIVTFPVWILVPFSTLTGIGSVGIHREITGVDAYVNAAQVPS